MRLGAQLYTVREFTKTPAAFDAALRRIAAIGYEGVQLSAVACLDEIGADAARAMLDEHGLTCAATHRPFDTLLEEISFHQSLGCDYVAVGMPPKGTEGIEGFREWIASFPPILDALGAAGIAFGYHNHAFEFQRYPEYDGLRPIDVLIEEADPRLQFELDTYWAVHAGVDLHGLLARLASRLDVVHLKDKAVVGWETRFAPVGDGNLDWPGILASLGEGGTEWAVVEQDDAYGLDPFEALERSFVYLKSRV